MDQDLIVNDMLIYIGTLLVAAAMFTFIGLCFLGCLLVGLAARSLQLAALRLSRAVTRQWIGWRGTGIRAEGSPASTGSASWQATTADPAGAVVPAPASEAVRLAE